MSEHAVNASPDERMARAVALHDQLHPDRAISEVDLEALWSYRLSRVHEQIRPLDLACMVLYDPVNIRYATATSTMSVFSLYFRDRYCVITAEGPVIFFEKRRWRHLTVGSGIIDETRDAVSCRVATGGPNFESNIKRWVGELDEIVRQHGGGSRRVAMDHCEPPLALALTDAGFVLYETQEPIERARPVKSDEEILHNTALLKAGVTLHVIATEAWKIPALYQENCHPFIAHGVGLCDEWPNCYTPYVLAAQDEGGIVLEAAMTLCVESYIGEAGGPYGVKLEQQVLVTDGEPALLSDFPFEPELMASG